MDYRTLPHPDYVTHAGMRGHKPETEQEQMQGYVLRLWKNNPRLRCCFCPYEAAPDEAGMQLHVFQRHWLKHYPEDASAATETRPAEARLFDAAGRPVTDIPVAKQAQPQPGGLTHNAPAPPRMASVENFQQAGTPTEEAFVSMLDTAVADMRKEGILADGENKG